MAERVDHVSSMVGKVIEKIDGKKGDSAMVFTAADGSVFSFWHERDCCEAVEIEDIAGDLDDLIGSPLVIAEETNGAYPHPSLNRLCDPPPDPEGAESFTWTFYRFATVKGYVTVRWLGLSNGYYSESVSFEGTLPSAEGEVDRA